MEIKRENNNTEFARTYVNKKIHMEPIKMVFYAEEWEWRMGTKMHK